MLLVVQDSCQYTANMPRDITLNIKLNRRTPKADFAITIPAGISFKQESVFVNIIGRGYVEITELEKQSAGRCGVGHEVTVGRGRVEEKEDGSRQIILQNLDLRPDNGIDVQVRIADALFAEEGIHQIAVRADVSHNGASGTYQKHVDIRVVSTITDFHRVISKSHVYDTNTDYQSAAFRWAGIPDADKISLLHSTDYGETWEQMQVVEGTCTEVQVFNLAPDREHWFCLDVTGGGHGGMSNIAKVFSGMYNVRVRDNAPTDGSNAAGQINRAITYINELGGGTVLFEGGCFSTTTIYLKSNVYLYIDKTAEIHALKGCDDEEKAWYSDEEFRADMSHMSKGPYLSPDNWMTKQDAGHSHWRNALFTGERLDNIKIIGNGLIAGDENLTKANTVMEHESGSRADKMVALKLCTNFEMGGLSIGKDLWYEETDSPNTDQPFYLDERGNKSSCGIDNMLRVSNGGHFVVLATGVDGISTHDIYAQKGTQVRDIFDYMSCNDILAFNIYAEGCSDDIIKLGSDCSLGFTRPARNCIVRNIIGDTACNLFQIGSETADDIQDVCIDNIYVLASDKAGFSISVNDGGYIRNVHLNCGGSAGECRHGIQHGGIHIGYRPARINPHKSKMVRIRNPFFISLSNRGRTLGGEAIEKSFIDDIGVPREELMVTNVNIGRVENVYLRNVDIREVYAASQAKSPTKSRWPVYEDQARTTPLIVGYKIPDNAAVRLPDGSLGRDIENVVLEEIDLLVKGGNPSSDADSTPRELGVGQFNLRNLAEDNRASKIPAYGYYVRHVNGMTIQNCSINLEKEDGRHAIVCDDVKDIRIEDVVTKDSILDIQKVKII